MFFYEEDRADIKEILGRVKDVELDKKDRYDFLEHLFNISQKQISLEMQFIELRDFFMSSIVGVHQDIITLKNMLEIIRENTPPINLVPKRGRPKGTIKGTKRGSYKKKELVDDSDA